MQEVKLIFVIESTAHSLKLPIQTNKRLISCELDMQNTYSSLNGLKINLKKKQSNNTSVKLVKQLCKTNNAKTCLIWKDYKCISDRQNLIKQTIIKQVDVRADDEIGPDFMPDRSQFLFQ